jgi:hypothetical protein
MKLFFLHPVCLVLLLGLSASAATTLHVATNARAGGDGSPLHPFQTLEEARNAIRRMEKRPVGGVEVVLSGGFYPVSQSFALWKQDSGSKESPVVYRAASREKVILFGGTILKHEWFKPLSDVTLKARLIDKRAASGIRVADLRQQGITDFGKITRHGWNLEPANRLPPVGLSVGGERMILARWPNRDEPSGYLRKEEAKFGVTGMVSYRKVIDPGAVARQKNGGGGTIEVGFDRMGRWENTGDIWLDGVLSATWEWTYNQVADWDVKKKQISLGYPELSGLGTKMRVNHFYFENVFEELDQPGEYFIDRERGLLYLCLPADFEDKPVILSSLAEPMITVRNASFVGFQGLEFETGRSDCIRITDCENVVIDGCEIRNFSLGGIVMDGKNNIVRNCHLHDLGAFGVQLSGGDLQTLEPGGNVVENCHIHHVAWDQKSQIPGIYMWGVGNIARHNEIHDLPHFAIRIRHANDCVVEWNEIYDLPNYHFFDGGAIYVYTALNPEQRGTVIRNNYFRRIPTNGIYIDNHSMGVTAEANVLWDVGNKQPYSKALTANSGGQNVFRNNIVIDCDKPVEHADFSGNHAYGAKMQANWDRCIEQFGNGKVKETPHDKYNCFKEFLAFKTEEEFRWPASLAENNLFFNPTVRLNKEAVADQGIVNATGKLEHHNNLYLETDPGFSGWRSGDFRLPESSPVYKTIAGFKPVHFERMGRIE